MIYDDVCFVLGNTACGKNRQNEILLTSLTPPHFSACPKPGPGFPTSYVKVLFGAQIDLIWFSVFSATFSNIMATSFSGERCQSTRREPPTMGKQLVNFITCGCESSAPFFVIYKAGREPTPYWW